MYKSPPNSLVVFAVLLLSFINAFWMLPAATLDSHECFVSVTAREMLQKNDFLWPTLNGVPRLQKTPLCYWLTAGFGKLTGSVDELSARLPSAIFAFLSAAVILYYLSQWLALRTAAFATALWSTSLAYIRCSHSARPDMAMTFFIVLCMLSFYAAAIAEQRRRQVVQAVIFWISFAMANMAKGPAPAAYLAVPLATAVIAGRKWSLIGKMLPIAGSLIFLAILLPWPLFAAQKLDWNLILWKREFIDRFYGDYAPGRYPSYYYLGIMFKYIFPWVVFLPMALAAPFYRVWGEKRPLMFYLWIWFVADFVFLTIDAGKRQHYILPAIPPLAALAGILLEDMIFSKRAYSAKFAGNILRLHAIVLIAAALISPVVIMSVAPRLLGSVIMLSTAALLWTLATINFFVKQKPRWATAGVFSGIIVCTMLCHYSFTAVMDTDTGSRDFAKTVTQIVPASDELVACGHVSSRFVQYYGKIVPEISDIPELKRQYENGRWIVCTSGYLKCLRGEDFRVVYSRHLEGKADTGGILMHKPATADGKVPQG